MCLQFQFYDDNHSLKKLLTSVYIELQEVDGITKPKGCLNKI